MDIYIGFYDMDKPFKINGVLTNGFDYHEGQIMFRYFYPTGAMTATADISMTKTEWRKIARCRREKLWKKLKNLFGDE